MLHQNSRTFEFPNFSGPYTNKTLTFQGDASASDGIIQLTKTVNGMPMASSVGRVSYAIPVRLWNAKTGKLASFDTSFSFFVTLTPNGGDGISFFIAPFQSEIPTNSGGGYLGLFSPDSANSNTSQNQIVAVEFDTFSNRWDPEGPHIGIDINSISSVTTVPWLDRTKEAYKTVSATVTYEPVEQKLSVLVSYPGNIFNGSSVSRSLSHVIDLKTVLPEWVSVGFSGATGDFIERHDILSWTFSSGFY